MVAGLLAVLNEHGLMIDRRRITAPTPVDHLQVFALISGSAVPSIVGAAFDERPVLFLPYAVSAASVFAMGLVTLYLHWRRQA